MAIWLPTYSRCDRRSRPRVAVLVDLNRIGRQLGRHRAVGRDRRDLQADIREGRVVDAEGAHLNRAGLCSQRERGRQADGKDENQKQQELAGSNDAGREHVETSAIQEGYY